jgi:hypothetical protein
VRRTAKKLSTKNPYNMHHRTLNDSGYFTVNFRVVS